MGERLGGDDVSTEPQCDGLCVDSADIGVPGYGIAYPHPGCPLHAPGEVCGCGMPDRCLSPTHSHPAPSDTPTDATVATLGPESSP